MAHGVIIWLFSSLSALWVCSSDAVQPPRFLKVSLILLLSRIPCLRKGKSFYFFFPCCFQDSPFIIWLSTVRRWRALLLSLSYWELVVLLGCVAWCFSFRPASLFACTSHDFVVETILLLLACWMCCCCRHHCVLVELLSWTNSAKSEFFDVWHQSLSSDQPVTEPRCP